MHIVWAEACMLSHKQRWDDTPVLDKDSSEQQAAAMYYSPIHMHNMLYIKDAFITCWVTTKSTN
jgi:hypothetical protein